MASSYDLEPVSFTAPTTTSPYLQVSFRLPSNKESDAIHPATGLQLSFNTRGQDVFLERLTSRDVTLADGQSDVYSVRIPDSGIPRFGVDAGTPAADTVVSVHAWKGEKWLGSWELGRLQGREVVRA